MSEKMSCPVCNSHTSSVLARVMEGGPCPYCGAPAATILEVNALRERRGDEELKREVERLTIELGRVTAQRDRYSQILSAVSDAMAPFDA